MLFGKHINRYYIKYLPAFLGGILALLLVDYMQLVVPELYRTVINGMTYGTAELDGVTVPFDMPFLLDHVCLPLIVVIVTLVLGRFVWRICFLGAGVGMETNLRGKMFDRCKDLSPQYYQVNKVGGLMSLFTNDLDTVQECFGWAVLMFCDAAFLGVMALIKMFRMNPLLAIFSMIPMAFMLSATLIVGWFMTEKWKTRQAAFSALSDYSQESFSGIAVVKAFVKESVELWNFKKLNRENEKANVRYTKASVLLRVSITLFIESVMCVILGYGGYLVYIGRFNAGQLVEFIGYFNAIIWPVMAIGELIELRSRGKASLKRISELLDAKTDVIDREDVKDVETLTGDITFKNLTFRYPDGDMDVLEDVSFDIKAGENVGIIGRTGSGKTTIVDLILRCYNVPDGSIFLDGHDVNTIPIKTVRTHTAYVPQDNFLFSDTIANNIAFASDSDDFAEVEEAARLSDIDKNIKSFTEGYETVLGERGVTVSGGQKQRISIARALMKNPAILILDDSVSAVDVKTEKVILDNLRALRKGKTTILIAHRVSTVENMDKILFVEDGRVIAVGTHSELLDSCPAYRNTVELQKLDEEREAASHV
ncbi:MAG: ABC transporter ATP-binding protein [Clostridia bacterium]|nr:ABC transporter ATP-binding protein [Clostridia bacterium]